MPVLLVLLAVPILEIVVFLQVGDWIGLLPTVGLIVATAVGGMALLRWQGLSLLTQARASLARGEPPVQAVFDGVCLLIAGVLMLTPGFITDLLALVLMIPPGRRLIRAGLGAWLRHRSGGGGPGGFGAGFPGGNFPGAGFPGADSPSFSRTPGVILEGEAALVKESPKESPEKETTDAPSGDSRWGRRD